MGAHTTVRPELGAEARRAVEVQGYCKKGPPGVGFKFSCRYRALLLGQGLFLKIVTGLGLHLIPHVASYSVLGSLTLKHFLKVG